MKLNIMQFLRAISSALDFIEMDVLHDVTYHNQRVVYICDCLAVYFEMDNDDRVDLATCAFLHDCGSGEWDEHILNEGHEVARLKAHCFNGEKILQNFPLNIERENVLLYHHEYIDGSGFFGVTEVPFFSKIISLANMITILYDQGKRKREILENIEDNSKFDKKFIDAFKAICAKQAFWFDMENMFISKALENKLPHQIKEISWQELEKITHIFSDIIDIKSKFTSTHSKGLSKKADIMARFYGFDEDKRAQFVIAANLHDLGKLAIPNEILDKNGALTEEEFAIVKKHTYLTRWALSQVDGFERITEWASNHHEKLNKTGYPFGKSDLCFECRLMVALDIYQALTEDRPYRKGLSHKESKDILDIMVRQGEIDALIVRDIGKQLKF